MIERIENKWGVIDIERPVIAKIVKEEILKHEEVYGITNAKGHRSSFLSKFTFDKDANYIVIRKNRDGGFDIEVFLILYFGKSISEVTSSIIDNSRRLLKELVDFEPVDLIIHVVGLKSKKIIERDIVIRG